MGFVTEIVEATSSCPCSQVGFTSLRQDRRSPQRICFPLRERRGEFEQLERVFSLAR